MFPIVYIGRIYHKTSVLSTVVHQFAPSAAFYMYCPDTWIACIYRVREVGYKAVTSSHCSVYYSVDLTNKILGTCLSMLRTEQGSVPEIWRCADPAVYQCPGVGSGYGKIRL